MDKAFEVHMLNEQGKSKAKTIAEAFDVLLTTVNAVAGSSPTSGRELAIVKTKLEEACFFAKKAMANQAENQA